jgi:hypothetical protein
MRTPSFSRSALGLLLVASSLAACQRHDLSERADFADTRLARFDLPSGSMSLSDPVLGSAVDGMHDAAMPPAPKAAGEPRDRVTDAVITSSVHGELAKDASLAVEHIEVDTSNRNVALRGTAPDAAARERATLLAARVQGVARVDNALDVEPDR